MADPAPSQGGTEVDEGEGEADARPDGRHVRRERNRLAVLEAVLELIEEDLLVPSIDDAAKRSGLSLRSVYRYFPDAEALVGAAIEHHATEYVPLTALHQIGRGPFPERVEAFVAMRLRLYARVNKSYRATVHHAPTSPQIRDRLHQARRLFTEQFERQFAPELAALAPEERQRCAAVGDSLTQLDSIDLLRRHRCLTEGEAAAALTSALTSLLGGG